MVSFISWATLLCMLVQVEPFEGDDSNEHKHEAVRVLVEGSDPLIDFQLTQKCPGDQSPKVDANSGLPVTCLPNSEQDTADCGVDHYCWFNGFNYLCCQAAAPAAAPAVAVQSAVLQVLRPKLAMPRCPRQQHAVTNAATGQPIQCLPALSNCPPGAACWFSGVNYHCCPMDQEQQEPERVAKKPVEVDKVGQAVESKTAPKVWQFGSHQRQPYRQPARRSYGAVAPRSYNQYPPRSYNHHPPRSYNHHPSPYGQSNYNQYQPAAIALSFVPLRMATVVSAGGQATNYNKPAPQVGYHHPPRQVQHNYRKPTYQKAPLRATYAIRPAVVYVPPTARPELNRISAYGKPNQHRPTYQRVQPTAYARKPVHHHPASSYRQPQPSYRTPQPTYNRPQPTYNRPQPTYNRPQPTYNRPQPSYHRPQHGHGQGYAQPTKPPLTYGQLPDYKPPTVPQRTYQQRRPTYRQPAPKRSPYITDISQLSTRRSSYNRQPVTRAYSTVPYEYTGAPYEARPTPTVATAKRIYRNPYNPSQLLIDAPPVVTTTTTTTQKPETAKRLFDPRTTYQTAYARWQTRNLQWRHRHRR